MSLKLYHLSDLHYYSRKNWMGGNAYEVPQKIDQLAYRESADALDRAVEIILSDTETDVVIVTGDMTSVGDKASHEGVVACLNRLRDSGKKVYAFVASHDFPWTDCAFCFDEKGKLIKRNDIGVTKEEANDYYVDFGYNEAAERFEGNQSFVVDLSEDLRLIAICTDYYNENYPKIAQDTRDWIKKVTEEGKAQGKTVIAASHHPFLSPSPVYKLMGGDHDMIQDSDKLVEFLSSIGIDFILTGHSHIHDVSCADVNGKPFYDVSVGPLCGFPPMMRRLDVDTKGQKVKVETIPIDKVKNDFIEINDFPAYCRNNFIGFVEGLIKSAGGDIEDFAEKANSISIKPATSRKLKWLIIPIGKYINGLTFGRVGRITKKETGYKKSDYADIKDEKVVPYIIKAVESLYGGNASNDPNGKQYRIFMALIAVLDDLIARLPIDFRKLTGFNSIAELVTPLVYNNGLDDYFCEIDLTKLPEEKQALPTFKSNKGLTIILIIALAVLLLLPVLVPVGVIVALILALKKLLKGKSEDENKNV